MKPDICTSLLCDNLDCLYCKECSNAIFKGEGKDWTGKVWQWQYNPYHGREFLDTKGQVLKNQPEQDSPAWKPFGKWYKDFRAKCAKEPRFE